jgi:hypothetical protein
MRRARPDELTDGAMHDYLVSYPSGFRYRLRGVFGIVSRHRLTRRNRTPGHPRQHHALGARPTGRHHAQRTRDLQPPLVPAPRRGSEHLAR